MEKIPASVMQNILALRSENGLEPTETAALADLTKSKAKWALVETPRYRKAGRSPIFVSGKYLTGAGFCPATGEADASDSVKAARRVTSGTKIGKPESGKKIDKIAFYRMLHGKGFEVKVIQNLLTNEVVTQTSASISKLNLQFMAIPANASGVHVTQTSPQIQVSMPIETFLEIAGIKS